MANIDLTRPIAELAADVHAGRVTAVALTQASLERITATADYHAHLEVLAGEGLEFAADIDQIRADYEQRGELAAFAAEYPLAGVPFAAKDNYLTTAGHTTAASNMLKPFRTPYSGPALARLQNRGAVLVAKANMDAFAHGSSTENSDFGPTKNPVDGTKVPGGSSGGSAAAVALGQVAFALGTDTGGSIRLPASYCGVVGLKPTYGLVPRTGVIAMGSSVDVLGPLVNRVADAGLVLAAMAGRHPSDATSIEADPAGYAPAAGSLKGRKIGLIKEYLGKGVAPAIRHQVEALARQLEAHGAVVETVSVPATERALAAYYVLVLAEISSNLARYDGIKYGHSAAGAQSLHDTYLMSREEGFGTEAKRRIMIGTYVLSSGYYDAYYKRAQKVRTKLVEEFTTAFKAYDFLMGPTAPTAAFALGANAHDPLAMYLNDVMTVAVNLVGAPAISVPLGQDDGLPVGLQLIAPQREERKLLAAAGAIEAVIGDWRARS